jgi:hypothetical protein
VTFHFDILGFDRRPAISVHQLGRKVAAHSASDLPAVATAEKKSPALHLSSARSAIEEHLKGFEDGELGVPSAYLR